MFGGNLKRPFTRQIGASIASAALFDGSTGYLEKSFANDADGTTCTFSFWSLMCPKSTRNIIISSNSSLRLEFQFENTYQARIVDDGAEVRLSDALIQDDMWVNTVIEVDTNNETPADRLRVTCNGVRLTMATEIVIAQGADLEIMRGWRNRIGTNGITAAEFFNGYLAEFVFIDGHALPPSKFGRYISSQGIWAPVEPNIADYGINGFHLKFADGNLGLDSSGNGNDWTVVGGVAAVKHTPTDVYPTFNEFAANGMTLSDGNRVANRSGTGFRYCSANLAFGSGVKYWEVENTYNGGINMGYGVCDASAMSAGEKFSGVYSGTDTSGSTNPSSGIYKNNINVRSGVVPLVNSRIGILVDADNNEVSFYSGTVLDFTVSGVSINNYMPFIGVNSAYAQGTTDKLHFDPDDWINTPAGVDESNTLSVSNIEPASIVSGTNSATGFIYTGGMPGNISGVTYSLILHNGFMATSTGSWTCDVEQPFGADVMPQGVLN